MRSISPSSPQTLPEWLTIATSGLVPSAKTRIRTEIEAHYAEAVQARLTLGASESDAHSAALADLGDAGKAARRFRREHLTKLEVNTVLARARFARGTAGFVPWGDLGFLLLLFIFSVAWLYDWAYRPIFDDRLVFFPATFLLLIISYASLSIAVDVLARRKPSFACARRIFWLGFIKLFTRSLTLHLFYLWLLIGFFFIGYSGKDPLYVKLLHAPFAGLIIFWSLKTLLSHTKQTFFNFRLRKKLAFANASDFPGLHPGAA